MQEDIVSYQLKQKKQTLAAIVWTIMVAGMALGIWNIQYRTWDSVIALFGLAIFCIPIAILNSHDHYFIAGILLSLVIIFVIGFNLYDGDGILDSGILAYPILIMAGALFFGKRLIPFFLLISIISLVVIVTLERAGYVHPTIHLARYSDLISIIIILLSAALIVWILMSTSEYNVNRVKTSQIELRMNYILTLEAWAKAMEYRDIETAGHSSRLVELSTRLARALGCSEEEIDTLRQGALLHDVGKLAIPDNILLKRGELDENEKDIIKKHPDIAQQMLSGISFLEPSLTVAYCHHEHWNGEGYPQGLKGEQIPKLARIFAVIDCWDALNSDRPYRKAWPREKAIAYLKDNAGIIFDPHVVEVFLHIL